MALIFRPKFPASAPKMETKMSMACSLIGHLPSMAAAEIAAAGSITFISAESQLGTVPRPVSRRKSKMLTRPGPDSTRSQLTCP